MAVSVLAAAVSQTSSLDSSSSTQAGLSAGHTPASNVATQPVTIDKSLQPIPQPATNSNLSSLSSSPRQFPTDLTGSILEEGDETESEPPNEPVTPVSGRQSQDFHTLTNPDAHPDATHDSLATDSQPASYSSATPASKPPLVLNTSVGSNHARRENEQPHLDSAILTTPTHLATSSSAVDLEVTPVPLSRRSTRGSSSASNFNFARSMSNLFKRNSSLSQADKFALSSSQHSGSNSTTGINVAGASARNPPTRRWSMNKSSATTRSNTPPSPSSPLEMAVRTKEDASKPTLPNTEAFSSTKKKSRATTGFSLRTRNGGDNDNSEKAELSRKELARRRASSFDYSKQQKSGQDSSDPVHMKRSPWALPAESGTGVKARRMSLSLPDDFTVDVVELLSEFEYAHKLLGRHGKHLGKGATSKVTLMARKGVPGELYAVKEFRGKSSSETREEYEKKIKSEFTVAKSLHHPNIVETIRLCTDRGRWNHVMEYCQEGDLFSLVSKKYLKTEDREKDRHCLFKQLVQGIAYLHKNGIAHRDIKLENLLVTSDSKLKITDFGVSEVFCGIHPGLREAGGQCGKNMEEMRRCSPGICGSEPYIAPEVIEKSGDYDPRALDVWSAAIVMINLIFGGPLWHRAAPIPGSKPPRLYPNYADLCQGWETWRDEHPEEVTLSLDGDYPRVAAFDRCIRPPALRRVLLQMLNPDPDRRISIADVIKNRWVKGIECCQLESYDDPSKTIDASKMASLKCGGSKTYCHNHLPPKESHGHSLGKMPGSAGY